MRPWFCLAAKIFMLLLIQITWASCGPTNTSGYSGLSSKGCTFGVLCDANRTTDCYNPNTYQVDPSHVDDNVVCRK